MRKLTAIGVGLALSLLGATAMAEEAPKAAAEPTPPAASSEGGSSSGFVADSGGTKVSLGVLAGFGLHGDPNFYGLGFGARVGVNLSGPLYVGGTFVYHLGKEVSTGASILGDVSVKVGIQYYGAEVGYDLAAGPVVIRPYAGIGMASVHADVCIGGTCASGASDSKLYVAPGAVLIVPVGNLYVGADVRYVYVTGDTNTGASNENANALSIFGTIGYVF